ncbi:hypothetical protein GGF31_008520 [Allomyces arbusculus]|nr:hypothetical protein GGF31_008520 [Allomyces arbusculus]
MAPGGRLSPPAPTAARTPRKPRPDTLSVQTTLLAVPSPATTASNCSRSPTNSTSGSPPPASATSVTSTRTPNTPRTPGGLVFGGGNISTPISPPWLSSASGAPLTSPSRSTAATTVDATDSHQALANTVIYGAGTGLIMIEEQISDVSVDECHAQGLPKLLLSRIPLCYFLAHHIDLFAPENLFFLLDIAIHRVHPAVVFDTYIAGSAPLELNLPEATRLAALTAWAQSDPVASFDAAREGVMTMLEESWISWRKSLTWRDVLDTHSGTRPTGQQLVAATTHLLEHLNKRYPTGSSVPASAGGSPVPSTRQLRRMGLDSLDGEMSPHRLIRAKVCEFVTFCFDGNVPDDVFVLMYPNSKKGKRGSSKSDGDSGSGRSGSGTNSSSFIKSLFGSWGPKKAK